MDAELLGLLGYLAGALAIGGIFTRGRSPSG